MEVGHIVRFCSQKHPFLIETSPCLDLACDCSVMGLTLTELDLGAPRRDRLTFTLRVCLRTWSEQDPPPRSLEVNSLAHEFMARFPTERIQELGDEFERARFEKERLTSLSLSGSPDELVTYSEIIRRGGGIREGSSGHSFFFVFEGREFLVEDHYCANPRCDCQEVHVEFWERVQEFHPERRIEIGQRLMVTLNLDGKLKATRSCQESASTAKYLLQAWRRRCNYQLVEFQRRYELIKRIGARSFPIQTPATKSVKTVKRLEPQRIDPANDGRQRMGRNDPCFCGSGLKFKRCCARRTRVDDR